ncbi:hypothetical protein GGS21DRAFT_526466 [Xylaria nigripes]|nr:hypothetical protein GGS21DRAFT_526466 [Xylaria nigripes]
MFKAALALCAGIRSLSASNKPADAYTTDKAEKSATPSSFPKPAPEPPATKYATRQNVAEINYPDPLPAGFQPGKKCGEP